MLIHRRRGHDIRPTLYSAKFQFTYSLSKLWGRVTDPPLQYHGTIPSSTQWRDDDTHLAHALAGGPAARIPSLSL